MLRIFKDNNSILAVIFRELWNLFVLNILTLISMLLVVTIPASLIAAYKICERMVQDKSVSVYADFKWHFKKVSIRDCAFLWAMMITSGIPAYSSYIYFQLTQHATIYSLPLTVSVLVFAMWVATIFIYLNKKPEEGNLQTLKQSLLKQMGKPSLIIKINIIVGLFVLIAVAMFPLSFLFIISIMPPLCLLFIANTMNKSKKREIEGTCHVK